MIYGLVSAVVRDEKPLLRVCVCLEFKTSVSRCKVF